MDSDRYDQMLKNAREYNARIAEIGALHELTDAERVDYNSQLDIMGNGIMGYIEIKKINCFLPIYHGTSDAVLTVAVGHIEGSSLPIGGKTTHTVLSGHRGLPSAKLFTDLDKLAIGDTLPTTNPGTPPGTTRPGTPGTPETPTTPSHTTPPPSREPVTQPYTTSPHGPDAPPIISMEDKLPQTGQLWWPTWMLGAFGMMLLGLGIMIRFLMRQSAEESDI